ncbi:S-DNA-T family DNA segregation ATPase FtsK/SpoIIIE [Dysgonomonadaceae bacterium PH5-43]|nr:S-DNA-T family DNA segregation ATPase FtsK/SpoIIIE [Dysgonomonadaceae bacterium PH5-43]
MAKRKPTTDTKKENSPSKLKRLKTFFKSSATHYIIGLFILLFAIYAGISMLSFFFTGAADQSKVEGLYLFHSDTIQGIENWTGMRGAILSNILMNELFGVATFFLLLFVVLVALRLMKAKYVPLLRAFIIYTSLMIWTSVAVTFFFGSLFKNTALYIGGKHGFIISDLLTANFGLPGAFFIILLVFIIIMIIVNANTIPFLTKLFNLTPRIPKWKIKKKEERSEKKEEQVNNDIEFIDTTPEILVEDKTQEEKPFILEGTEENTLDTNIEDFEITNTLDNEEQYTPEEEVNKPITPISPEEEEEEEYKRLLAELGVYDPTLDLSDYKYPSLDLLKKYDNNDTQVNYEEQTENKNKIINTLDNYGIKIKSIKATVGPTITLYEIVPAEGVRVSKIKNLEDDIALSLAAIGIRIIAPMPGKGTIGIEVPNKDAKIVSMHSILSSRKYQESKHELPVALGKTITNEVFMVDLAKAPHLLVAGATGQGKSVGLNAVITSLLYKKHPAELKFVLIDPKMVEFSIYSVIEKHYLAKLPDSQHAIITDFTKVVHTLNSLTREMDDRYELLQKAGSRNVLEYNEKFKNRRLNPEKGHKFMPYIVVIIDEFGDLIMTAGKDIELPIARIAQKARAVGIHMVIATQRPTTNIITGTIKANFPARVAFRVTSMIDSRTILDSPGANQLIGRGDLLYYQGSEMTRVQCAFVDTPEVDRISKHIGTQRGYPTAFELPEYVSEDGEDKGESIDLADKDPMFEKVARLIVIHQSGSTSLIQRKFSIGYNRAGRLMDQLEAAGIVGPGQGSKAREVYVSDEYQLEQILQSLD